MRPGFWSLVASNWLWWCSLWWPPFPSPCDTLIQASLAADSSWFSLIEATAKRRSAVLLFGRSSYRSPPSKSSDSFRCPRGEGQSDTPRWVLFCSWQLLTSKWSIPSWVFCLVPMTSVRAIPTSTVLIPLWHQIMNLFGLRGDSSQQNPLFFTVNFCFFIQIPGSLMWCLGFVWVFTAARSCRWSLCFFLLSFLFSCWFDRRSLIINVTAIIARTVHKDLNVWLLWLKRLTPLALSCREMNPRLTISIKCISFALTHPLLSEYTYIERQMYLILPCETLNEHITINCWVLACYSIEELMGQWGLKFLLYQNILYQRGRIQYRLEPADIPSQYIQVRKYWQLELK